MFRMRWRADIDNMLEMQTELMSDLQETVYPLPDASLLILSADTSSCLPSSKVVPGNSWLVIFNTSKGSKWTLRYHRLRLRQGLKYMQWNRKDSREVHQPLEESDNLMLPYTDWKSQLQLTRLSLCLYRIILTIRNFRSTWTHLRSGVYRME